MSYTVRRARAVPGGVQGGSVYPSLRQATQKDRESLWMLHCDTMREHVEPIWGWDVPEQRSYFLQHFDPTQLKVIEAGGHFVGVSHVVDHPDHIYIKSLEILPRHQRRGIGSAVVRRVLAQAQETGLPVRLQVLRANPARHLYQRLGFSRVGETQNHYQMEWVPRITAPGKPGAVARPAEL